MSAKSMTQPSRASTGPRTWISTRNEWPWTRAHLCPAGTFGSRCADSSVNDLKISTRDAYFFWLFSTASRTLG